MGTSENQTRPESLLRRIPSVDELVREILHDTAMKAHSRSLVTEAAREVLDSVREAILSHRSVDVDAAALAGMVAARVDYMLKPRLVPVVNATGCVIHTNIGRSPLAPEAIEALRRASGACNVELDLATGERGERDSIVEELIKKLTGAEAACVVNNNAAAVLITLNTLAEGREVVVSRGEQIEIGGSFRLPEIIAKSGCVMREVGTTNRTHPSDYTGAIGPDTALIFKAHTSNYRIEGFTSEVPFTELVNIGRAAGVPVALDLGSGSLVDMSAYGLPPEPVVRDMIASGADVVTFSGDKLLGGPQAGIIVGRRETIGRIRKNPLKRALRPDKLTYAALEATLRIYLDPDNLAERLPVLASLARTVDDIERAAREAATLLRASLGDGYTVEAARGESVVGGGAMPGATLPTWVVVIEHGTKGPDELSAEFLASEPPVLGRVHKGRFMLDMRTVVDARDVVPAGCAPARK